MLQRILTEQRLCVEELSKEPFLAALGLQDWVKEEILLMQNEDQKELLELLKENGIHAWMEPSSRGGQNLKVVFSFNLSAVHDHKGLLTRLINFNSLPMEF